MSKIYIVSACLCGVNCKYNGKNNYNEKIHKLELEGKLILVCPEVLGGLQTPRVSSEIVNINKDIYVVNQEGEDVTSQFRIGAQKALEIAKENNINVAILKGKSPSCGLGKIYDGTFSKTLKEGNGITAQLFIENNIKVYTEDDLDLIKLE